MPPRIQKTTAGPAKPAPRPTADAWDLIDTVRLLVYGQSGTGKTTFWATFPGPILALICSGGNKPGELRSINTPEHREKISPRIVTDSGQLKELLVEARDYATVVLDHVSGLQDLTLKEILGLSELPAQKGWGMASQQQYGASTLQCKEHLRSMLNLPGNIVIVGQERTFGGRDEGIDPDLVKPTVGAAVSPSLANWLNPACDYVVQTFKRPKMIHTRSKVGNKEVVTAQRGKGVEFCLRTEQHDTYMTKFRVPLGRPLPDVIVDPTYDKIMEILQAD